MQFQAMVGSGSQEKRICFGKFGPHFFRQQKSGFAIERALISACINHNKTLIFRQPKTTDSHSLPLNVSGYPRYPFLLFGQRGKILGFFCLFLSRWPFFQPIFNEGKIEKFPKKSFANLTDPKRGFALQVGLKSSYNGALSVFYF